MGVVRSGALSLTLWLCVITAGDLEAQSLNQEMASLAASLTKSMVAQGLKNVAAVDFTDLQGQPTELGRYLSERLTVEIVAAGGVSMLDRANIKSILAEHKLTEAGLVNPANAKKLGEFAGVDVILIGNVTTLDGVELMVKGISTESARIVAAGRVAFPKTPDIQQLLNRGIAAPPPISASATSATGTRATTQQAGAVLAARDIGSLRVALKSCISVKGVKLPYGWGGQRDGLRCSFELTNLATQSILAVALNASGPQETALCSDYDIGRYLRTTIVDDRGTEWALPNSGVTGLGMVGVGKNAPGCADAYNPTEIVRLLPTLDETGSNISRSRGGEYRYAFGSTTVLSPGQSRTVGMTFVENTPSDSSTKPPKTFELQCELVIGVASGADSRRSYSLENVSFGQLNMPAGVR
jgi:hypothetical protein